RRHTRFSRDWSSDVCSSDLVAFQVRAVTSLAGRPRAGKDARARPLMPPEPELLVAGVNDTHLCLLNKYPVLDHHALIVTRTFERSEERRVGRESTQRR